MASAEESATWRILFSDSEENIKIPVADFHTNETSSAAKAYPADRDALALPRMPHTNKKVNENGKIIISAKADAADTGGSAETDGFIPIILIHKQTNAVTHRKLRVGDLGTADFVGFKSTADIVLDTSNFTKLGHYVVPSGYMATLDAGKPVHLYLGDDTA